LEPRPRQSEFDKVLECGVYDALWMLTKQWQFGEFQGEDTGSAIFAKIHMQTTPITRIKTANGVAQTYTDDIPLEERIENLPYRLDFKSTLEAAFIFLKCLDNAAAQLGVADYNSKAYKARLKSLYPLGNIDAIQNADSNETILSKSETLSNENLMDTITASANRYFDGFDLYEKILNDTATAIKDITNNNAAHNTFVTQAVNDYISWFEKNFNLSSDSTNTAWLPSHLEYQFACASPGEDGNNTVLSANEYYSGDLDWYSFDVNKVQTFNGLSGAAEAGEMANITDQILTVIPTEAKFAGAPNSRWWQFENGSVDLGNINAGTTDLLKLIFTEYALLYNTDWLLVPYRVPVGTICEIKGIVVRDVFGEQSFIEPAIQGETDNWAKWGMFNLSTLHADGVRDQPADTRLFIPPAVVKNLESEPLEEVHFIRDEMTNHVWAIEVNLSDKLGNNRDGQYAAKNFRDYLQQFDLPPANGAQQVEVMFKYTLANTVPENWLPFIPVHIPNSNRDVQLQRASMPRMFRNEFTHIRPRTQLLRVGIDDTDQQTSPYFINEEEIPRTGVQLTATFQRTRWYNGAVVNWYGNRKQVGRGEGSSGLYYDRIDGVKKE
jgi:hypothetical protein